MASPCRYFHDVVAQTEDNTAPFLIVNGVTRTTAPRPVFAYTDETLKYLRRHCKWHRSYQGPLREHLGTQVRQCAIVRHTALEQLLAAGRAWCDVVDPAPWHTRELLLAGLAVFVQEDKELVELLQALTPKDSAHDASLLARGAEWLLGCADETLVVCTNDITQTKAVCSHSCTSEGSQLLCVSTREALRQLAKAVREYTAQEADSPRKSIKEADSSADFSFQTVDFVYDMQDKWLDFTHGRYTIERVLQMLETRHTVESLKHAERLRVAWPEHDWLHVAAVLHGLCHVLALWGDRDCPPSIDETFPVGCKFSEKIGSAQRCGSNPDSSDPMYNTETGMYSARCGLSHLTMSWGPQEYIYHMLRFNESKLPDEALDILRLCSFRSWHTEGEYESLCTDYDLKVVKPWIHEFNKHKSYTLDSNGHDDVDVKAVWPYYKGLLAKYNLDGLLSW